MDVSDFRSEFLFQFVRRGRSLKVSSQEATEAPWATYESKAAAAHTKDIKRHYISHKKKRFAVFQANDSNMKKNASRDSDELKSERRLKKEATRWRKSQMGENRFQSVLGKKRLTYSKLQLRESCCCCQQIP